MRAQRSRSVLAVGASALLAALLIGAYLAAGGAGYEPAQVRDPCQPREWRSPDDLQKLAEQFTLSALDGAACELGVSREVLARALATQASRERFAARYEIDDARFEEAVHAGLLRGIDDAQNAGALSPIVAVPLREIAKRIPVEEAITLIMDARPIFESGLGLLNSLPDLLQGAGSILPGNLGDLVPSDPGGSIPSDPGSLLP